MCADVHGPLADIQSFMAKSTVRSNITKFSKDISATASNGLTYILGQTNSISCHGAPGEFKSKEFVLYTEEGAKACPIPQRLLSGRSIMSSRPQFKASNASTSTMASATSTTWSALSLYP